jgi:hypothetical protein
MPHHLSGRTKKNGQKQRLLIEASPAPISEKPLRVGNFTPQVDLFSGFTRFFQLSAQSPGQAPSPLLEAIQFNCGKIEQSFLQPAAKQRCEPIRSVANAKLYLRKTLPSHQLPSTEQGKSPIHPSQPASPEQPAQFTIAVDQTR